MSFEQAFEDAQTILTIVAFLPAMVLIVAMGANIDKSSFDLATTLETFFTSVVNAVVPTVGVLVLAVVVAVLLLVLRNQL